MKEEPKQRDRMGRNRAKKEEKGEGVEVKKKKQEAHQSKMEPS